MITLSVADAVALVRRNLDEIDPNGSIMYEDENGSSDAYGDNRSLEDIVARTLPEAVNAVHLAAPVGLLEGEDYTFPEGSVTLSKDGVLTLALGSDSKYLRLVAFRAKDSAIVVTDIIPEASAEGRKQLNKYIRGRADRPRLVQRQGRHTGPLFDYYSVTDPSGYEDARTAVALFQYVKEQIYSSGLAGYDISRRLRQNIIDCLTAKVMEIYSDQRSQSFYEKANNFPAI